MNIYEAISNAMNDIGVVGKNSKNQQQGFMFRGIDAVMNAINPALIKNHIFIVPEVLEQIREERVTQKGTTLIYSVCKIKYTFYAEDGSFIESVVIGEGMDSGDKATTKAMSIAFKYACFQIFCIPTEEMKDPDAEVHEVQPKNTPTQTEMKQTEKVCIDEAKQNVLKKQCEDDGVDTKYVCEKLRIKSFADITEKQFYWLKKNWSKEILNGNQG